MSAGYGGGAMERRIDPYDGKTQTLQEMVKKYQGTWVAEPVTNCLIFDGWD